MSHFAYAMGARIMARSGRPPDEDEDERGQQTTERRRRLGLRALRRLFAGRGARLGRRPTEPVRPYRPAAPRRT